MDVFGKRAWLLVTPGILKGQCLSQNRPLQDFAIKPRQLFLSRANVSRADGCAGSGWLVKLSARCHWISTTPPLAPVSSDTGICKPRLSFLQKNHLFIDSHTAPLARFYPSLVFSPGDLFYSRPLRIEVGSFRPIVRRHLPPWTT